MPSRDGDAATESPWPLVRVTWIDSALMNVQVDTFELPKPEEIVTVGWLVKDETPDYIVVSRDQHHGGEQWRGSCSIPCVCIKQVEHV
jgi:hypothetical protein